MKRDFESEYWIGDIVFLRVAPERYAGMVTALRICPQNCLVYEVGWEGRSATNHYAIELTSEFVPQFDTYTEAEADKK